MPEVSSAIIIFKTGKPFVKEVVSFLKKKVRKLTVIGAQANEPLPFDLFPNEYDVLVSYLCPWVLPVSLLERARLWNINFHPGPPEYPGTGCFNFALYNRAKSYGVTAHLMDPRVDSGQIIGVRRFGISANETVSGLMASSYVYLAELFLECMGVIFNEGTLPESDEQWLRRPYKRTDLEALCQIDETMALEEVERRLQATFLAGSRGPYLWINGRKIVLRS